MAAAVHPSDVDFGDPDAGDVDLVIVTMRFDAADAATLMGVLSKYVVLTRMQPGCRNVDLCASVDPPRSLPGHPEVGFSRSPAAPISTAR